MDKKQYVLKVLDIMKDAMPLARGLIILIEDTDVDEKLIDTLISAFNESLKDIKDDEIKHKLEKGKHFLEEMKRIEIESKKRDEEDLQHLDDMLLHI